MVFMMTLKSSQYSKARDKTGHRWLQPNAVELSGLWKIVFEHHSSNHSKEEKVGGSDKMKGGGTVPAYRYACDAAESACRS